MNPHGQPLWAIHVGPPMEWPCFNQFHQFPTNIWGLPAPSGDSGKTSWSPTATARCRLVLTPQTLGCDPVAWFAKTIPVSRFGDVRSASQPDTVSLVSLVTPKIDRKVKNPTKIAIHLYFLGGTTTMLHIDLIWFDSDSIGSDFV